MDVSPPEDQLLGILNLVIPQAIGLPSLKPFRKVISAMSVVVSDIDLLNVQVGRINPTELLRCLGVIVIPSNSPIMMMRI